MSEHYGEGQRAFITAKELRPGMRVLTEAEWRTVTSVTIGDFSVAFDTSGGNTNAMYSRNSQILIEMDQELRDEEVTGTSSLRLAAETLRMRVNDVANENNPKISNFGWEASIRDWLGGPTGEFCAMMSPEVVLALAELLDEIAHFNEQGEGAQAGPELLTLVRKILREEESQ